MHIKRKTYLSFFLLTLITLNEDRNVSCAETKDLRTPPRSENQKEKADELSPASIADFPDNTSNTRTKHLDSLPLPRSLFHSDSSEGAASKKDITRELGERLLDPSSPSQSLIYAESKEAQKDLALNTFKTSLETIDPDNGSSPAAIEHFVNAVLYMIDVAKQSEVSDEEIGTALNETAEKFREHDYFSVDRFDGTLTTEEQNEKNARLMENWQKWYTYKLLAYFYKKEAITKTDEDIIDKSMRSDDLDVYRSNEYYEQIYVPGKPFYDNKNNSGQDIYIALKKRIHNFSYTMDSLNRSD